MIKTLLIALEDAAKSGEQLTIAGTLDPVTFNPNVVISVGGQFKIQLNSMDLASALKTVVDFQQTPNNITTTSNET